MGGECDGSACCSSNGSLWADAFGSGLLWVENGVNLPPIAASLMTLKLSWMEGMASPPAAQCKCDWRLSSDNYMAMVVCSYGAAKSIAFEALERCALFLPKLAICDAMPLLYGDCMTPLAILM